MIQHFFFLFHDRNPTRDLRVVQNRQLFSLQTIHMSLYQINLFCLKDKCPCLSTTLKGDTPFYQIQQRIS